MAWTLYEAANAISRAPDPKTHPPLTFPLPPPEWEDAAWRAEMAQRLRAMGMQGAFETAYAEHGRSLLFHIERWRFDVDPERASIAMARGWKLPPKWRVAPQEACWQRFVFLARDLEAAGLFGPGWIEMEPLIARLDEQARLTGTGSLARVGAAVAAASLSALLREGRWRAVVRYRREIERCVLPLAPIAPWREVWGDGALSVIRQTLRRRGAIRGLLRGDRS